MRERLLNTPLRATPIANRARRPRPSRRALAARRALVGLAVALAPAPLRAQDAPPPGADSLPPAQVHQRGLEAAWANRFDEAIAWLRLYRRIAPDSVRGLVTIGRVYGWARRYPESVAAFDSAVAREPSNLEAASGAAQTLAWAADWPAALARYEALVRAHPDNREVRLQYARTLGWSQRFDSSAVVFAGVAAVPDSLGREARRGLARVAAWRGDLGASIRAWSALAASGDDAEALAGLGQALRWSGDAIGARRALRRAAALAPDDATIREQLGWADADANLAVEPGVLQTQDSDGNRSLLVTTGARIGAAWGGRISVVAGWRQASFLAAEGSSASLRAAASWRLGTSGITVRADAGANRTDGRRAPTQDARRLIQPFAAASVAWRGRGGGASLAIARRPFDDIALLIANGISTTSVDGNAEWSFPWKVTAVGDAGWTSYQGGSPNQRLSGALTLLQRPVSWAAVGGVVRRLGHSGRPLDGYFAPRRYQLAEGIVRLGRERDLGVMGTIEVGIGQQEITFASGTQLVQGTQRVTSTVTWRPVPRFEVSSFLDTGRMASPFAQTGARYEYFVWGLRGRVPAW